MTENKYNPREIETEAQKFWEENKIFEVSEDPNKEKYYSIPNDICTDKNMNHYIQMDFDGHDLFYICNEFISVFFLVISLVIGDDKFF